MKRGKQYTARVAGIDLSQSHTIANAIGLVRQLSYAKFDETIEMHVALGIDPRQADQQLRGTMMLPHGTGRKVKLAVIAQGQDAQAARDAGVVDVGQEDLIERIGAGWFDFDLLIATPDMMAKLAKLGKRLGSKGLMPNPKSGTVTTNIKDTVTEFLAGKCEYRNDKSGIIHTIIGKRSFTDIQLIENFEYVMAILNKSKPAKGKKGSYLQSIAVCSTMGPGVKVDPSAYRGRD